MENWSKLDPNGKFFFLITKNRPDLTPDPHMSTFLRAKQYSQVL